MSSEYDAFFWWSFAIFLGGSLTGIVLIVLKHARLNGKRKVRVENQNQSRAKS